MKKRDVWFDARDLELDNNILSLVFEKNFDHLLIRPELYKKEILPKRMSIAVHVEKIEQLDELEDVIIFSENEEILREAKEKGTTCTNGNRDTEADGNRDTCANSNGDTEANSNGRTRANSNGDT